MTKKIIYISMVASMATLLSGCGMTQLSSLMPKNPFGSKAKTAAVAVPISSTAMLTAAKETVSTTSVMPSMMEGCPKFKIWPTGNQLTIYQKGKIGDNTAIRHRGEISKVARECSLGAGNITVKFGVSGRVLLGPKGTAGKKVLPMLVYVTGQTGKKIMTSRVNVSMNIAAGKPFGYFSSINRITFKVPKNTSPNKLKIYVAFDSAAPGAG